MDRLLRITDTVPDVFEALISISLKQHASLTTKQANEVVLCDYGECSSPDTKQFPSNIIHLGTIRDRKNKVLPQSAEQVAWKRVNNE